MDEMFLSAILLTLHYIQKDGHDLDEASLNFIAIEKHKVQLLRRRKQM